MTTVYRCCSTEKQSLFKVPIPPPFSKRGSYTTVGHHNGATAFTIFHHYHSTAHEVLGFVGGHAKLILGGENGHRLDVYAGDGIVLPTGTGHCKLAASSDFLVVGAYPPDQHWDICRTAPSREAVTRMRHLAFPKSDPVFGVKGPLATIW
jgi:uncharacterized protein YjlB